MISKVMTITVIVVIQKLWVITNNYGNNSNNTIKHTGHIPISAIWEDFSGLRLSFKTLGDADS